MADPDNPSKIQCPRCDADYEGFPSLSRHDNLTNICSSCGMREAYEDAGMTPTYDGPVYWKEVPDETEAPKP